MKVSISMSLQKQKGFLFVYRYNKVKWLIAFFEKFLTVGIKDKVLMLYFQIVTTLSKIFYCLFKTTFVILPEKVFLIFLKLWLITNLPCSLLKLNWKDNY